MLCPPALPRRLRHAASPDTLPTVRLADRETTARKPDLPSSLAWTPTGGLPPGPAACSLRARWDHQSQAFPDAGSREGDRARQTARMSIRMAGVLLRSCDEDRSANSRSGLFR